VMMNTAVFTLARLFQSAELEANGLSAEDAANLTAQIQQSATSPDVFSQYAAPLPSGVSTTDVLLDSVAAGLHINGVIGAVLAVVCVLLVRAGRKR